MKIYPTKNGMSGRKKRARNACLMLLASGEPGSYAAFRNRRTEVARTCPEATRVISLALHGTEPHELIKSQRSKPRARPWSTGKDYPLRITSIPKAAAAAEFFAVCDNLLARWMEGGILLRRYYGYVR